MLQDEMGYLFRADVDPSFFKFGIELETCVNITNEEPPYAPIIAWMFDVKEDDTIVCKSGVAREFVTKKILTFDELERATSDFAAAFAALRDISVGCGPNECGFTSCGVHVHVSTTEPYNKEFLLRFQKLWEDDYQPFFIE